MKIINNTSIKSFILIVLGSFFTAGNAIAEVRLWVSTNTTNGAVGVGGRTGVDSFCDGDGNKPAVASSATRAFISVSGGDQIANMPANYSIPTAEQIFRADGTTVIASNYAALLNTGSVALQNSVGAGTTFTGSDAVGNVTANTCNGWTDGTAGQNSNFGIGGDTGTSYLGPGSTTTCDAVVSLYCITYSVAPVSVSASPLEW